MSKLAIITARGGSKRIPGKNIKNFQGIPIIAYPIKAALESGLFSQVMVSTDSDEIAEIAQKYGASVPFVRSTKNSDDFATTADVLTEVLKKYKEEGELFDSACCLYPTAPFITSEKLVKAFHFMKAENYDSVFPVVRFSAPIQRALRLNSGKKVSMFTPEHISTRSQDLEAAYHDAGQFYFFKVSPFLATQQLWTQNSGAIVVPESEVQDIDNQEDWELAEMKFQWLKQKKQQL